MPQSSTIAPVSERPEKKREQCPRTRNSTSRFNRHSSPGSLRRRFLGGAVSSRRGFLAGVGTSFPRGCATVVFVGSTPSLVWTIPDTIFFAVDLVCTIVEVPR